MIKMIELKDRKKAERIFKNPTDSVVFSIVEGKKGYIWADDEENPTMAFAFDEKYGYLDGDVTKTFVEEAVNKALETKTMESVVFVPQNPEAERIVEECSETYEMKKMVRYKLSEPEGGFNTGELTKYIDRLPPEMKIVEINESYFNKMMNDKELEYLTESYEDYEEFAKSGTGYLIVKENKIVAGAVTYSSYSKGIEVQLMTVPEYRGKGLATTVVARLLLWCAENKMHAIWDAANLTSVSIAKKMGYTLEKEYYSYKIPI